MEAETPLDHELQSMHRSISEAVSSDAEALLHRPIGNLASLEDFIR
jgi:transcription factor TGA